MRALIGLAASAPLIAGSIRAFAASSIAAGTSAALAIASIQAAVPSSPTGPEPTTGRPAARNSRMLAV